VNSVSAAAITQRIAASNKRIQEPVAALLAKASLIVNIDFCATIEPLG
jgi:hypothetical protein